MSNGGPAISCCGYSNVSSRPRQPSGKAAYTLSTYRLRKGGTLARRYIAPERLAFYAWLVRQLPAVEGTGLTARFTVFLRILAGYLDRLPNEEFTLDLRGFTVSGR